MSYQPKNITREHVLRAIEKINSKNPKLRPSREYNLIIDGKAYPPKEVMRYAHREIGVPLEKGFSGGTATNNPFIEMGFEIRPKGDSSHQKTNTNNVQKIDLIVKLYSESVEVEFKKAGNNLFNIGGHINFYRIPDYIDARKKLIGIINDEDPNEKTRILLLQFFQKPKTPNESDKEYDKLLDLYKVKPVKSGKISVINAPIARAFLNQFKPLNNIPSTQKDKGAWDNFLKDKTKVDRSIDRFILELRKKIEYKNKVFSIKIDSQSKIYKSEDGSVINEIIWAANLFEDPYTLNKNDCYKAVTKWVNSLQLENNYITSKLKDLYNKDLLSKHIPFSFYLDQIINLIHKVGDEDIMNSENQKFVKLYKTALEIKKLGKGIDKIDNNSENANFMKETSKEDEKRPSLNTILYGPPGTGKTYNTINKAVDIVVSNEERKQIDELKKQNDEKRERKKYLDIYKKYAGIEEKEKSLFNQVKTDKVNQIEFVTFHQNYTYEDFVVGLKPNTENDDNLTFKENYGIFYRICKEAYTNYIQASSPSPIKTNEFEIRFNKVFSDLLENGISVEFEMQRGSKIDICDITDRTIRFNKQSGTSVHTLSKKTLENYYYDRDAISNNGLKPYYDIIAKKLDETKLNKNEIVSEEVSHKNYVLIIDEINRANISRVFGELITLLEDDKRIGKENELIVTLPNGEVFGVPPNLYIIGTMNTADKSIALIDIALRRRFEFEAKFPEPELLKDNVNKEKGLLEKINENIIAQGKSADFTIGHAFFMKDMDTEDVIKQKIIPLLMEYFNNNTSTVEKVLVGTGYEFKYSSNTYLWSPKSEESNNVDNIDSDTK